MSAFINKDTKIFGSFSSTPGNNGCKFFNHAFQSKQIDAIYKSFRISNIEDAFEAAYTLGINGFALAMPFKQHAAKLHKQKLFTQHLLDNSPVKTSINTVVRKDNQFFGYNTDYLAAKHIIKKFNNRFEDLHLPYKETYVLGNGGLAAAVSVAATELSLSTHFITRENWQKLESIKNCFIINCTPVDVSYLAFNNTFIDCRLGTSTGDEFFLLQAKEQFNLYTDTFYE